MWASTSGWEQARTSRKPKTLSGNTHESRGKSAWRRRSLLVCHISEETGSILIHNICECNFEAGIYN